MEASTGDGVNSRFLVTYAKGFKSFLNSLKGAEEAAPISSSRFSLLSTFSFSDSQSLCSHFCFSHHPFLSYCSISLFT